MHFPSTLRYFQKNNARNINYMTVLIFFEKPRFEKKCLFSDSLLGMYNISFSSTTDMEKSVREHYVRHRVP